MSSQNICNICGANYEYVGGRWKCPACGAYKAEELSNEEVTLLYNAAQKLRLSDFDEAEKAYSDIIGKFPENPDGYWGRLLSRYGIKYEEDFDGRKIPTCYATSIESVITDKDYLKAIELADEETRAYYITQAEYIERVRKEWVEKARKEKPYDIFICYKDSDLANGIGRTEDSIAAQELYIHLTRKGYRVFFSRESLRDKVGEKYEPYIFNALSTAKVMLVYGSSADYITSTWLKNEWTRYEKRIQAGEKKPNSLIVACDGFSPSELPKALSSMQCLDAAKRSFYEDLDDAIQNILKPKKNSKDQEGKEKKKTKWLSIAIGLAVALITVALAVLIPNGTNDNNDDSTTSLNNTYYGISVEADKDVFPKGTELMVEEVVSGEKHNAAEAAIGEISESFKVYDIELKGQDSIDINGSVTVKIPLPNGMFATGISVYYISDSGASEKLESTVVNGYVTFKTTHFSIYVIAEDKVNNTGLEYTVNPSGNVTISKYTGSETVVVIPKTIEGKPVTEIGSLAFDSMDKITSVTIPESVTTIGAKAFYGCTSITTITIPETVTTVGTSAFYGWSSSQEIIIPGHKETPTTWNAQWNGSCSARIVYGLITVMFHANSGSGTMSNQTVEINSAVQLNENKFSRIGYVFAGWATFENGESVVLDKGSYAVGKESVYHLYAVWSANENKIVFNSNGGSGEMSEQAIRTDEKKTLSACLFSKTGYTFAGWSTSSSGSAEYSDGGLYTMGSDSEYTLYAVWVSNHNSLIFNSGGALGSMDTLTVDTDETISLPENLFTKDGYSFVGWSESEGGEVKYTNKQSFTMSTSATVTLYAVWQANENELIFNANGGSGDMSPQAINTDASANLKASAFERFGYTFIGWSTTATGGVEYTNGASYTMGTNSTYTLYAVWKVTEYKISYILSGGENHADNPGNYTAFGDTITLENPLREGYTFKGWFSDSSFKDECNTISKGSTGVKIFYALWEQNLNTIVFNANGGSGEMAEQKIKTDDTVNLSKCTFKRESYYFLGWSSEPNGKVEYEDEASYKMGTNTSYTLYAIWKVDSFGGVTYGISTDKTYAIVTGCSGTSSKIVIGTEYEGLPVKAISNNAFKNSSITSVFIPNSVTSIGYYAFYNCTSLTSVVIPDSVTSIGSHAFYNCTSLTSVTVDENNQYYKDIDGNLYSKDGKTLILYAIGKTEKNFVIPDGVTTIGSSAFAGCTSLTGVTISDSVTTIDSSAFNSCNSSLYTEYGHGKYVGDENNPYAILIALTDGGRYAYSINSSTKIIATNVFSNCNGFTHITIPDSVTSIGDGAFSGCGSLKSVVIPDSVTSIGSCAFAFCDSLENIEVDENNQYYMDIDGNLYSKDGRTLIQYAIGKAEKHFTIPDSVTSIGGSAFAYCYGLRSVVMPDSVTSIGGFAFAYTGVDLSTVIGNGVTSIGSSVFEDCGGDLVIPDSVTSIDSSAFSFGYITSITVGENNQHYKSIDGNLYSKDGKTLILYAVGKADTSFTIPDGVNSIGYGAFNYCYNLTSVVIPDSVTSIGDYAFCDCPNLAAVNIPDSVTSIGDGAFSGCGSLKSVVIPDGVTRIGDFMFRSCDSLKSVVIPDSVTSIGRCAFDYCGSLTSVVIPDSVTSIGDRAFYSCDSLTSIKYRGTKSMWDKISKGTDWDSGAGSYTIVYDYKGE